MNSAPGEVTQLLLDLKHGRTDVREQLIPLVYSELRRIAGAHLRRERAGHSLQPTALVHEAYLRMTDIARVDWQSRAHFFSVASTLMRRILVDHARARLSEKRGGGAEVLVVDEALLPSAGRPPDVLALDEALDHLAQLNERQAKIVEMRFFAGMTEEETGNVLGISARTVKRDWRVAKAWLFSQLAAPGVPG